MRARAQALAQRGHRVVWLTTQAANLVGVEEFLIAPAAGGGVASRAVDAVARRLGGWSVTPARTYRRLEEAIKKLQPDFVHVHYAKNVPAWLATVADRHPMVVSVMGGDVLFGERGPTTALSRWLTLQVLESADLITAKSSYLIAAVDRLGGFGHKTIRVVWGVDLERFRRRDPSALRRKLLLPETARVILSPKILRPFYNIHLVIDAMAELAPRFPDAILLITEYAADPDYKAQLVAQVARLGLEHRVRFVGHVPAEEMVFFYSLAELAVAVPPSDGLPQALFEAMACEVPNVLGRLQRYLEIVADRESVIFADINPHAISESIALLLEDRALAARLGTNGRTVVARSANLGLEVTHFEDAVYRLLESKPRARSRARRAAILAGISIYSTAACNGLITERIRSLVEGAADRAFARAARTAARDVDAVRAPQRRSNHG